MSTDTDHFTFDRTYALSPDQLWHLLTDADMRAKWGNPDPDQAMTPVTNDLRVGGKDLQRAGPEDGPEFEVATRWYNLGAPENLVFTETIIAGGMSLGASLVTYKIAATDSGCTLAVNVAVSSFVGPEMNAEFRAGWTGGMAGLDTLVAATANA